MISGPGLSYAVQVNNVFFDYKNSSVLKKCSIQINAGEIFALLGANGSGKTTILKLIVGRVKPKSGCIRIFYLPPGDKRSNIPGPGVGFMPQEIALFPEFTIEENLKYFAKIFNLSHRQFEIRFNELTQLLDLCERNKRISEMSGGQQRLVSMAAAILHKPKLIILDEPTVGVDPILRERIWKYLEDTCRESGNTVIITTHYIEEAKRASTVGFMKSGSILRQSNPRQLMEEYQCSTLEEVFLHLWQQNDCTQNNPIIPEISLISNSNINQNIGIKSKFSKNILDFHRVSALLWKSLIRVKINLKLLLFYVSIPMISLLLLNPIIGNQYIAIPVAVFSAEPTPKLSNQFINSIDSRFLNKIEYESKQSAIDSLYSGKNIFAILFAQNFSDEFETKLLNPFEWSDEKEDNSMIRLYVDNSRGLLLYYGFQNLAHVFDNFSTNVSISLGLTSNVYSLPITIEPPIYGSHPITGQPQDRIRIEYDNMASAIFMIIVYILSFLFSSSMFIQMKDDSKMDRYFVCGGKPFEIIVANYIISMIYSSIAILLNLYFLCGIQQKYNYSEIILSCFLVSIQAMAFGVVVALLIKEEFNTLTVSTFIIFAMMIISGVFWPSEAIRPYIRVFVDWTPITKPIDSLRSIMIRGLDYRHLKVMMGYVVSLIYAFVFSIINMILFNRNSFNE